MSKKKLQIDDLESLETEDQSKTLFHKELGAHYRSVHGANQESNHVFVQGSRILEQKEWKVIELGFGLGTNFRNLLRQRKGQKLEYWAVEHQPIPAECIEGNDLGAELAREALLAVREHNETVVLRKEGVDLHLLPRDLFEANLPFEYFTACFHDPFGPKINPEAWTKKPF